MGIRGLLFITLVSCLCLQALAATNYYTLVLDITVGTSVNGVNRTSFVINGTSPGPLITGTVGDTFIITVINQLTIGTSMHWHGLLQTNTNPNDGVSGLTQCVILPNTTFVYNFTANQYGTYWYHAHTSAHYIDGFRGPFIIYNNPEVFANLYDEEIVLQITDWYNQPSWALLPFFLSPASEGAEPVPDSTLINGVGYFNCKRLTTGQSCSQKPRTTGSITVTPGKRYRVRIINEAALSDFHVSIDNHNMTIIEADGVDYTPYVTQNLEINVAQRYSVIITADQAVSNYWIRVAPMASQYYSTDRSARVGTYAKAILNYAGTSVGRPRSKKSRIGVQDTYKLAPAVVTPAPAPVNVRYTLEIHFDVNAANVTVAMINNVTYSPNLTLPYVYDSFYRNSNFGVSSGSFYPLLNRNDVVELVIINNDNTNHPVHMHGHTFAVLGSGPLPYDPTTANLNLVNPPMRDVATIRTKYWLVWRFQVNNPGVWLWHCHIAWHLATGFAVVFNELPNEQITSFTPFGGNITSCAPTSIKYDPDF